MRHLLLVEGGQRFQIGPGEVSQRHLEDVQLALLDEPQQQRQRPVVTLQPDVRGAIGMGRLGDAHGRVPVLGSWQGRQHADADLASWCWVGEQVSHRPASDAGLNRLRQPAAGRARLRGPAGSA